MQNDNFGLLKGQLSQHQSGTFTFLLFKNGFSIVKKALFSSYFSIFRCHVFLLRNMQFRGCFCINIHVKGGSSVVEGSTLSDGKSVKDIYILK